MAASSARRKPRLLLLGLNFSIADMLLEKRHFPVWVEAIIADRESWPGDVSPIAVSIAIKAEGGVSRRGSEYSYKLIGRIRYPEHGLVRSIYPSPQTVAHYELASKEVCRIWISLVCSRVKSPGQKEAGRGYSLRCALHATLMCQIKGTSINS